MSNVLTKDISRVSFGGQYFSKVYKGNKLIWPPTYLRHESIEFTFDQKTGRFNVIQDAGFIEYLLDNTTCYLAKCTTDGKVVCIPLYTEPDYDTGSIKHAGIDLGLSGSAYEHFYRIDKSKSIYTAQSKIDFVTQVPTIYFRCREVAEDMFDIQFSTYPFEGCHEVFGPDRLIGLYSGHDWDNKWYSNVNTANRHTFTECKQLVANKGKGWYGAYSEEIGVLLMLGMFKSGVNGQVLTYNYAPFGIANPFTNGGDGRNFFPNIEIDPATNIAHISHLDGTVEQLQVPYIWGGSFATLHWGEYLTIIPKEKGSGIYYNNNECWIGNNKGISIYCPGSAGKWAIAGDRNDSDATGVQLRIRACYHGEYTVTDDIEYFENLPIL